MQIAARPETVWEFLVDPEKLARWKGRPAAAFDPRPGGGYRIEVVPGNIASGEFVELEPPRRLVYTWGWEPGADGPNPVPPGSSTVEIELVPEGDGHEAPVHAPRPAERASRPSRHAQGWDHYLERLAVAAAGGDPGPDPWLAGVPRVER